MCIYWKTNRFKSQFTIEKDKIYCYGGSVDVEGTILLDECVEIDII